MFLDIMSLATFSYPATLQVLQEKYWQSFFPSQPSHRFLMRIFSDVGLKLGILGNLNQLNKLFDDNGLEQSGCHLNASSVKIIFAELFKGRIQRFRRKGR